MMIENDTEAWDNYDGSNIVWLLLWNVYNVYNMFVLSDFFSMTHKR